MFRKTLIVAVLFSVMATACAPAAAPAEPPLKIAVLPILDALPMYVAEAQGYYAAAGIQVEGPLPADTLFTPRVLQGADCVLAMYHDQGLPVLKYAGFGEAVNITLGLPYIRTSVDHGTALDLAAQKGREEEALLAARHAFAESEIQVICLREELSDRRHRWPRLTSPGRA